MSGCTQDVGQALFVLFWKEGLWAKSRLEHSVTKRVGGTRYKGGPEGPRQPRPLTQLLPGARAPLGRGRLSWISPLSREEVHLILSSC